MRVLLVIALVLQTLASAGLTQPVEASAEAGTCACATACCCADACMCVADSAPGEPGPVAPSPRDGKEPAPLPALTLTAVAVDLPDFGRHGLRPKAEPAPRATHNEIQALLCVWRT